jgi:hypothetical protein
MNKFPISKNFKNNVIPFLISKIVIPIPVISKRTAFAMLFIQTLMYSLSMLFYPDTIIFITQF